MPKFKNTKSLSSEKKPAVNGLFSQFFIVATIAFFALCHTALAQSYTPKLKTVKGTDSFNYSKDLTAKGYLAEPKKSGKYPALVMIHEWWGLTDDIKEIADRYADIGYVVLAVDLYNGASADTPKDARALSGKVRKNVELAMANLTDAVATLKKRDNVAKDRIGTIGWCFGGGWAYQMAKNAMGVKVSVMYYGRMNASDDFSMMKASIIGHFADKDRGIKIDDVVEFQAALKTASGNHEVYIYPNTTHGFASREATNKNFNPQAAKLAWQRTLTFLQKHL